MDREVTIYPYDGTQLSDKDRVNTHHIEEFQNHTEWMKQAERENVLYDFICRKLYKIQANLYRKQADQQVLGDAVEEE